MRLFVAIFPPADLAEALAQSAREVLAGERLRFTRSENIHLTLKFLGEVPEDMLDYLVAALTPLGERHSPFEIEARGPGAFPNPRRAKVLWAGVGAGADELKALASDVEGALGPLGFERERRPFTPHFTLGRARRALSLGLDGVAIPRTGFVAERFDLVESGAGGTGMVYRPVSSFALVRPG